MIWPDLTWLRARVPRPVTRFAPSPTGYLHLGHVVNAIYVWGVADALGGTVLVRIEDHDRIRSRPEYESALLEDLEWLGFLRAGASTPVVRQREREAVYAGALACLRRHTHVYACDCSRATIGGERYPGRCRHRNVREDPCTALRLSIGPGVVQADDALVGPLRQVPDEQCGDLVIRDRHGHWTYQFAVTVDDLEQQVSLVIRGADLIDSTGRQIRLGDILRSSGCVPGPWPPTYLHHPLLYDAGGAKLSKSTQAAGVRHLRDAGLAPADVIGRAAAAAGLLPTATGIEVGELASLFARQGLETGTEKLSE